MDTYIEIQHDVSVIESKSLTKAENVTISSSKQFYLKEASDGREASCDDYRDSDTISESEEKHLCKMLSERRASFRPQPKETVPYTVQPNDTLEGIAARYNITPSELTILNKLQIRTVFPGQIIYIPEKNSLQVLEELLKESSASASTTATEQDSPKPGHVERIPGSPTSEESSIIPVLKDGVIDRSVSKESLRINSRYVTDGEGVVCGVLIVTTNHIIFDPNVSDPLVIEYGMDKYGVEAPMGWIVKAALYTDIFRMRKDASGKSINVYHSKSICVKKSKSHEDCLGKSDTLKSLQHYDATECHESGVSFSSSFQEILSKICEHTDDSEDKSKKADSKLPQPLDVSDNTQGTDETKKRTVKKSLSSTSSNDSDDGPLSQKASISDDDGGIVTIEIGSPKKKSHFEKTKHKLHKGLKRLSISDSLFPSSSNVRRMSMPVFSSFTDFKLKSPTGKNTLVADKCEKSLDEEKSSCNPTYVNMVEEKPELFAPLDKLIPRPAKSFCNTPLYLCLRMGEPIDQTIPRSNPVIHFGQKMKAEYWFSIPKDYVDCLYHFFLRWFPEKYGEIDNINYEELGYLPIENEEKEPSEEKVICEQRRASWSFPWRRKSKDAAEITTAATSSPEDWEILDYLGAAGNSILVPELLTPSTILSEEQILEIAKHLPARAMNSWSLIYSTTAHGFSLKTMYRKMTQFDSPVLIVIANRNNDIFGALLSSPLKMSDHFYGTGESFLFTFSPEFQVYHWAGENNYFIKGNTDSFIIGSSEGQFGLWLDDDLFRGCTNACQTFANAPLCAEQDFVIKSLEAWGFV